MKYIYAIILSLICTVSVADDVPPMPAPRVSLFSTTVDWAAVTGLPLHQYAGEIVGKNKNLSILIPVSFSPTIKFLISAIIYIPSNLAQYHIWKYRL